MRTKMKNAGKDWTVAEVEELRRLASENYSKMEIAIKLGRTPVAIQCRAQIENISIKVFRGSQNRTIPHDYLDPN